MISLECDYNNGAHPKVLQRLIETNNEHTGCYGFDVYCDEAKRKIMAMLPLSTLYSTPMRV